MVATVGMATAQILYIFVKDDDAAAILGMVVLLFSAKDVMASHWFAFWHPCRNSLVSVFGKFCYGQESFS